MMETRTGMATREGRWLSVDEAARRLGVHPNTVRKWADTGILPCWRLPGSGHRRFDPDAVERLRQGMQQAGRSG